MAIQETTTAGGATEVELEVRDRDCFFVRASAAAGCRLSLEHLVHRSDGTLLEFFAIEGADPEALVEMADDVDDIDEGRVIRDSPGSSLVQFVVSGPCVTSTLADAGAVTRAVTASEGTGRVVANVPTHADVRSVIETFRSRHADTDLVATRQGAQSFPVQTELGLKGTLAGRLTDRQLEVFRTAYLSGYFAWPRERTAEECASMLGITQPTFSQHMRSAQRALAACLFEGSEQS